MYTYEKRFNCPRRRKGILPRAGTGTYYRSYSVYQNPRVVVVQEQEEVETTVDEEAFHSETCTEADKITKGSDDQLDQTEGCVTKKIELPPKKRRRKRDKVASSAEE